MNVKEKLNDFFESTKRVLTVAKKPSMEEFKVMAKVTGLGILLIGIIGFIVSLIFTVLKLGM